MPKRLLLLCLTVLLTACAAIGPTSSPEFPQLIGKSVPKEDGEIQFLGSGNWHPNARGFTGLRSFMLARPTDPIPGALALTTTALIFSQWDDESKKFDAVKRLAYSEIIDAGFDSFGAGRRLVVRKKDLSYDSFDFTIAGGNLVDGAKVEDAAKYLQSRIKQNGS